MPVGFPGMMAEGAEVVENPVSVHVRPAGLASLGGGSYFVEPYKIRSPHRLYVGEDVRVGARAHLSVVEEHKGKRHDPVMRIGDGATIGSDLFVSCVGSIEIGARVEIGVRVFIGDSGRDYEDPYVFGADLQIDDPSPVKIEDDAVVGTGAVILPGVTIGRRALVTAGSVVTGDVAPGSVVLGNPARFVRRLPETEKDVGRGG